MNSLEQKPYKILIEAELQGGVFRSRASKQVLKQGFRARKSQRTKHTSRYIRAGKP